MIDEQQEKVFDSIYVNNKEYKVQNFIEGVKTGAPIAIGYIPIAIAFGLLSRSSGIPVTVSISMSLLIFAGASQFIGVNLMAMGAATVEIVMTTFILNFRHFLMSSSLSQRITNGTSRKLLGLLAFGVTDETFSVASLRGEKEINPWLIIGLNTVSFTAWNVGTWVGIILGDIIPEALKSSMNIALYAMFIGLLIPSLKGSKPIIIVTSIAVGVNSILRLAPQLSFISTGWGIIISTVIAAMAGALLFPRKEE